MRIRGTRRLWTALMVGMALLFALALAGNTGGNCAPVDADSVACQADSDCDGVPPVDCIGEWQCVAGACEFDCDDPNLPPEGCAEDADCAAGEYCAFEDLTDCCPPGAYCFMDMPVCEGVCRAIEDPAFECQSDADCPDGTCVFDWDECPSICTDPTLPCPAVCGPPVIIGSHCEPGIPGECEADSDCPAGMACTEVCTRPADCAAGERCGAESACYRQCTPIEPPPAGCLSDAECAEGELCAIPPDCGWGCGEGEYCPMWDRACLGVCVPIEPPPVECYGDADCPEGLRCELRWDLDAECCPPNAFCAPELPPCGGGVCVPIEPPPVECYTDEDCGPGMRCEIDWALCPCAPDEPCPMIWPACGGRCVPDEEPYPYCDEDADCYPGEHCEPIYVAMDSAENGGEAGVPCFDENGDGWCEPPYPYGQCVPDPPPECWSDTDCGPGMMCLLACADVACPDDDPNCAYVDPYCWGQCVPREEPCATDADCPAGWHCELLYGGYEGEPGMPCRDEDGDGVCDFDDLPYGTGVCVQDPPPVEECAADWDCAADERCEIDESWCQWDCGPNMDCLPCLGRCVPIKDCLDDADCPGGTICDYGDWGCLPYACDESDPTCVPPPCLGVCREPDFETEC